LLSKDYVESGLSKSDSCTTRRSPQSWTTALRPGTGLRSGGQPRYSAIWKRFNVSAILLPFRATGMSDMAVTMTYADVPSPQTGTTSFPPISDKTLSPGQLFTPFPAGKTNKSTKINLYTIWYDQLECRDITHGLSH
jgi:hypothetical protein